MGKSHHHKAHKGRKSPGRSRPSGPPDGAVYIGLLMIGAFGIWLWTIVATDPDSWKHAVIGFVLAIAVLVNLYTWRVCAGKRLAPWQQSLARLPLRWVGYGTKGGKPLDAAHGSDRAKMMLFLSVATSAVVIALLTWQLIP